MVLTVAVVMGRGPRRQTAIGMMVVDSLALWAAMLFERRARVLSELSFGLLFVVCVGHCLYVLVPGRGPYAEPAPHFQRSLAGGFWWPLVSKTVSAVDGALRTDVFPSLHTACPTFLTLFCFRNRAQRPYRYV